ncbi:MAG: sulfatase-like hydrolase/transferase [Candidatus Lernaella stagnicola]|nr:sulfatase-like hydrolase/transferase [Candidatus Lernaella stagnicola]
MEVGNLTHNAKRLLGVIPVMLVAGFVVGVIAAIWRVTESGDLGHGLWRTALHMTTHTMNLAVYGAFSLAVFMILLSGLQLVRGRSLAASLRAAVGFHLFYPVFMLIAWLATDLAVSTFHLETHKLPEFIRQNEDLGSFLLDRFLSSLDLRWMAQNLVEKAGWLWPSFFLAAIFATWFDRSVAGLGRRFARRKPRSESTASRWPVRAVASMSIVAALVVPLNMGDLLAKATNRAPQPNVILVSLDTVRADGLGCYGGPDNTPVMDKLAANGVLFEEAVSNTSWTLPGHGAMLAGVQPTALGLLKVTDRLSSKALTLAEVLREHGYDTGAIVSYILLDKVYGFGQGFEHFDYEDHQPATDIVDKAIAYIDERQQQKFFLFLHLYDAHWPYEPEYRTARRLWPQRVDPALRDLLDTTDYARFALKVVRGPEHFNQYCRAMYDGEVHDVDTQLGRLFLYLVERGMDMRTIIVVTSDHGEEFLEHGLFGHGLTLYDEALRVPLLMRFPHLLPSGVRVKGQVQTLDIFPTVLGLTGIDPARYGLGGRDLTFAAAAGSVDAVPMLAETAMSGNLRYALRTGEHKFLTPVHLDFGHGLVVDHAEEAYDLTSDPNERNNLAESRPKMREMLRNRLNEQLGRIESEWGLGEKLGISRELTAEELERLRSLGYLN